MEENLKRKIIRYKLNERLLFKFTLTIIYNDKITLKLYNKQKIRSCRNQQNYLTSKEKINNINLSSKYNIYK